MAARHQKRSYFVSAIDILTGVPLGPSVNTDSAFVSLEVVGSTLYTVGITGPVDFALGTVDPLTGTSTPIGATGLGVATSGLAYDVGTGTMYGVTAEGTVADLVTIDLITGLATVIGSTGVDRVGALEFGTDGVLYAGTSVNRSTPGALYSIDTATGAATFLFDGYGSITGLTPAAVPTPTSLALFSLGFAGLVGVGRRRDTGWRGLKVNGSAGSSPRRLG